MIARPLSRAPAAGAVPVEALSAGETPARLACAARVRPEPAGLAPSLRASLRTAAACACVALSALCVLEIACPHATSAQILYGEAGRVTLRPVFTYWNLDTGSDEINIRQIAMAISGFQPLQENTEARYFLASSSSEADVAGRPLGLRGLGDLRVQLSRTLANDRALLGMGLNLPTGKTGLGPGEEYGVMGLLQRDFLSFPVRRLGEGFGVNLMAGGAFVAGPYRLGATVTFDYAGAYQAFADEADYDPGDRLSLQLAAQRPTASGSWLVDATISTSGDDALDDRRVFSQGDQIDVHLGWQLARANLVTALDARYLWRDRNELFDDAERVATRARVYGSEFSLSGRLLWRKTERWSIGPSLELRWNDANEIGLGIARVAGLGVSGSRALGRGTQLGAHAAFYGGEADGGHVQLRGAQTSIWIGREF